MIRKMLVVAGAVALTATAFTAIASVSDSSTAGAVKTYTTQSCAGTGSVTFVAPGLSYGGTLGKKSIVKSISSVTATGTGCGSGASGATTLTNKLPTSATQCNPAAANYVAPIPPATLPDACLAWTAKLPYAYSNANNLASAGVSTIVTALQAKPPKAYDNGNKVALVIGDACGATYPAGPCSGVTQGTESVVLGACGSTIGFHLFGPTAVAGLTYDLLICLVSDTGPATTGAFFADYLGAAGNTVPGLTIATATIGGNSHLDFVKV